MDWLDGSRESGTDERSDVEDWRDGPFRGGGAAEEGLYLVGEAGAGMGVGVAPTVPPTDEEERRLVSLMLVGLVVAELVSWSKRGWEN
jgi:hypothetical protein